MSSNLVIVESPAKAKTIKKYLGKDFEVLASYGHVRDLVPKEGAVDTEHAFAMKYQVVERNQKHVDAISRALKKAKSLFLATDPDREGEAISWHLYELLNAKGELEGKSVQRVVFYEITKNSVREAMAQPRGLSVDLVNAQQARRALDFLVGFNLSPLLWKKVRPGLSAGRVQSPALRMICEREDEIAAFVAREYWTIDAQLEHSDQKFPGKLVEYGGAKVEQFSFTTEAQAREVERTLRAAAGGRLTVLGVDRKQRRRNPAPPFTTSTLQQEAARKLGFSAQKTMRVAQQLYEGVDIGDGAVGLITYMRTDSLTLAQEAVGELRDVIVRLYGKAGLADEPRIFKTKSKNAQEAHEAIRPTAAGILPADIEKHLEGDQFRLYSLIWKRTVACQMAPAIFDTVAVELLAGSPERAGAANAPARTVLRANGSTLVKPGYISVYQEGLDDAVQDDSDHVLPAMREGDTVKLTDVVPAQHFTEPPPRFSEASLVKALEEYGIGRPSTYASIISTLRDRQYVDIESRRFTATDIGKIVSRFLTQYFTTYVDYDFTAKMEDSLDAVATGEQEWVPLLDKFWKPFIELVNHTESSVSREEVAQARDLGIDPASGKPMSVRMGRFGPFVQIGTKDDEDKPRFAGLRPGQKMDAITHAQALELFKLPRKLGLAATGEEITTNVGRFGPYLKYGTKYVSLKTDDPYEITPERALEVIREKEIADANRLILDFPDAGIQVLNGRFGPYITDKQRNAKIPKDKEPKSLTLPECQALLAAAPVRTFGKWGRKNVKAKNGKGAPKAGAAAAVPAAASAARTPGNKTKRTAAKKASSGTGAGRTGPAQTAVGNGQKLAARASKPAANKKAPLHPAVTPAVAPGVAASRVAKAKSAPKKGGAEKKGSR
ncbi:MAG: DNA topoisomerase I [Pseudomonadota bacterium]|nr:DNA topoisomerase I [Pseudomonadota bacterium]